MRLFRPTLLAFLLLAAPFGPLVAQGAPGVGGHSEVFAGSELENYLRLLQLGGVVPVYPWSVRGFSFGDLDCLAPRSGAHPWAGRYDLGADTARGLRLDLVQPRVQTTLNTGFPWGANDGAVWAGRGITNVLQMGFSARYGPVSLVVAPLFFRAENAAFPLRANGQTGNLVYADGRYPRNMDRPQRFGSGPYTVLDPGQSTLRVDLGIFAAGISTANEIWGPGAQNPLILSNNAAGFPHVFFGTSRPGDVFIGRVHGHVIYGDLRQSAYTDITGAASRRFASGFLGSFQPRGLPGLELGVSRFFHSTWPAGGLSWANLKQPFQGILKAGLPPGTDPNNPNESPDNQLASAFARWVFPASGLEVYGEYAREDHNWDLRDFALEPDHSGGFTLGLRKLWWRSAQSFVSLRAELLDTQIGELALGRSEGPFYRHSTARQGHTEKGQVLGAADGNGGAGSIVALDWYHPWGRWTVTWTRSLQGMHGQYLTTHVVDPHGLDVVQTLGVDGVLFRGRFDLSGGLTAVYDFNRYYQHDAFEVNARLGVRAALGGAGAASGEAPTSASGTGEAAEGEQERPAPWAPDTTSYALRLVKIGSVADDRDRLAQLAGREGTAGYLIRSTSSRSAVLAGDPRALRWAVVTPEIVTVVNSTLPFSLNDGALWAGRGANAVLSGGVHAEWGALYVTVAPQLLYSQNRAFALPDSQVSLRIPAGRSPFSSPYHIRPNSADLPIRFGDRAIAALDPGQSVVAVRTGGVMAGASTENEWWGPGIRNAIVLSDQAAGIPRLFVRTAHPLTTRLGTFSAEWFVGALSESRFFDTTSANDVRSISALAVSWQPPGQDGLTLGVTRAVYAPASGWGAVPLRLFDVFRSTARASALPYADSSQTPGPDQVVSLFGRWVLPRSGFETWFEWARTELPASLRDFLTAPGHTQGYTLGLQWAHPVHAGAGTIRLQAEQTILEKSATFRDRPVGTWYTSHAVVQGYTQKGQVIGAGIGPGGSSHWLAADYVARSWSVGVFGGRIRWENDALYEVPDAPPTKNVWCSHDVSLFGGVRGTASGAWGEVATSLALGRRFDLYFENYGPCGKDAVAALITSPHTATFEVRFSPRIP